MYFAGTFAKLKEHFLFEKHNETESNNVSQRVIPLYCQCNWIVITVSLIVVVIVVEHTELFLTGLLIATDSKLRLLHGSRAEVLLVLRPPGISMPPELPPATCS